MMIKKGIPKSEGCFRRRVWIGCGLRGLRAKGGIVVDDELDASAPARLAAGRRGRIRPPRSLLADSLAPRPAARAPGGAARFKSAERAQCKIPK